MTEKEIKELSNDELLAQAKKIKSSAIVNAFLIGFLVGILIFSFVKSTFGLVTLIPLYFLYRAFNNPKDKEFNKAVKDEMQARNLK